MFKKTLIAAALTTAAMGANAWQVAQNETSSLEVYGVTAISIVTTFHDDSDDNQGWGLENETRVGFRGHKDLTDNLTGFVQIESGWVDNQDWAHGTQGGTLGQRDTFVGLRGDWGQVRFGRMLTPMYEIVDWPFSNPGLGQVFDWNSDIGSFHRDRHSNQIRYDGKVGGVGFALSTGRGDSQPWAAPGISGFPVKDNYFYGASASYTFAEMLTLQAGIETESDRVQGGEVTDTMGGILGAQVALPGGFSVKGAWKHGYVDNKTTGNDAHQNFMSLIGEYWTGNLGFRLGYAQAFDAEINDVSQSDTSDTAISFQPMYVVGGAVFYGRVKAVEMNNNGVNYTARLGLEYGF